MKKLILILLLIITAEAESQKNVENKKYSHLIKIGNIEQLRVKGKPFLILGGELGNSSFTSLNYMESIWSKLKSMNLNTVLAPVYWELIEPNENKYNFKLYDQLIKQARKYNLKIVLLWFGSWKNSMSSHVPGWVKTNQERFPRVKDDKGKTYEIITPFNEESLKADRKVFQALMEHIKEIDAKENTIIMVQVENEIGMLPTARDYSESANKKFTENVPLDLIEYLKKNKDNLVPEFKDIWAAGGYKENGTWEEIFGKSTQTDEIFMAWYYSRFTNNIASAGKEVYPIPMYVNAALNSPGKLPGSGYPSAGPLPHLMDVWKAGAPSIDFLSPDIYFPNIKHWSDLYTRQVNPLFVPEHAFDTTAAAKALFVFGHYEAMGFSPFSIESIKHPENELLGKVYNLVNQIAPILTENQGQHKIEGVLLDKDNPECIIQLGDYEFKIRHSYTLGYEPKSKNNVWPNTGAIIIQTSENEFYLAGFGVVATFRNIKNPELNVGILKDEEGKFVKNKWKVFRYLNGDQTHQGRHIRIFVDDISIQKFELYNYN